MVRPAMRTTILPTLRPPCSVRNACSCCNSMTKLCSGKLVAAPAPARAASSMSTPCTHAGSSAMSASRAIAQYDVDDADARWRSDAQMARLPISSKAPPSLSDAKEAVIKSSERLLSTACARAASHRRITPIVKAAPSRELHRARTPASRSWACLCDRPAVPKADAPSHCAYSTALSPTPPAAACTMIELPARSTARSTAACVVLHVTGSVHACSKDSADGLSARRGTAAIATDASGAWAKPNVES